MTEFGTMEIDGKDIEVPPTPFDRLAHLDGQLHMVSVVADSHRCKQIRAIFNAGSRVVVSCAGVQCKRADGYLVRPGKLTPTPDLYSMHSSRLDFGMMHALYVTRRTGFMPVLSENALWKELNTDRFTTPVLRSWVAYIERRLVDANLLIADYCHGCLSGLLKATTKDLDEIVTTGLKTGRITIPRKAQA